MLSIFDCLFFTVPLFVLQNSEAAKLGCGDSAWTQIIFVHSAERIIKFGQQLPELGHKVTEVPLIMPHLILLNIQ